MGLYTAQHNDKVNRLVLYAPLWIFTTRPIIGGNGPLGAYRTVTKESRRHAGCPASPKTRKPI